MSTTQQPLPLEQSASAAPRIHPWLFVPVLYFMQAVPNILVTETFGTAYKKLGVDNLQIALWTGLAALPWAFKMFWGPLVDLSFTKRQWTLAMQVLITATLILSALVMKTSLFFPLTVAAMFLLATLSATHDIACDGLYLMSLDRTRQAAFTGVMATFSRFGRLFCASLLVAFAGWIVTRHRTDQRTAWAVALGLGALVYGAGALWNTFSLPRPPSDVPATDVAPGERSRNILRTLTVVALGVAAYYLINGAVQLTGHWIFHHVPKGAVPANWDQTGELLNEWTKILAGAVLVPVLFLNARFQLRDTPMGDAFVSYVRLPGFPAILAFIVFYRFGEAMIFAMAKLFILGSRAEGGMAIPLERFGAIQGVGQVAGLIVGGLLGGWYISRVGLRRAFWPLVVCMHIPNLLYIWAASNPVWMADQSLTIPDWPLLIALLLLGTSLAAAIVSRNRHVWKAALIIALCSILGYAVAHSFYHPPLNDGHWESLSLLSWPLYPVVFAEAMGYGFGFAGYFVYLMHVAQRGRYTTSHYAIGTGLGALFIAFAFIIAGIVQSVFGYIGVFIAACLFTIPGTLTLLFIPLDNDQTRSLKPTSDH